MATNKNLWETNPNYWRTNRNIFGAAGKQTIFVDWDLSSNDSIADGTPEYPFATISYGNATLVAKGITPKGAIVRGHGNEAFVGNHDFTVQGDYMGAAIYDGGGTAQIIYCAMKNLIYLNGGTNVDVYYDTEGWGPSIHAAFAGCGRATNAINAVVATYVNGVFSSPILIGNSKMYRGCIGGTKETGYNIYSKIKCTPYVANQNTCGTTFGGYNLSATSRIGNCVVYDLPLSVRATNKSAQTNAGHMFRWIFSKVDFIYEHADFFYQCLFTSDNRMFFVDKTTGNAYSNKRLKIVPQTGTNTEPTFTYDPSATDMDFTGVMTGGAMIVEGANIKNFYDALKALYAHGHLPSNLNPETYFKEECLFVREKAEDIFNNPEAYDFTTKIGSPATINAWHYFGALPPALNIPIYGTGNEGSDKKIACWDNRSLVGCLEVKEDCIKIDTASTDTKGCILTKIITTNPYKIQFNGVYSMLPRRVKNGWIASELNPFADEIISPDENKKAILQENVKYILKGSKCTYEGYVYDINDVINTESGKRENFTVEFENSEGYLIPIIDTNIPDALYCRCRSVVYGRAKIGDEIKSQITYLNDGDRNILFNSRIIVPNESFICDKNAPFSVCDDNGNIDQAVTDYSIAVIFDDRETIPEGETRVGGKVDFVPAQKYGEYFAMKNAGAITTEKLDPYEEEIPKASGNYKCFKKEGNGAQIDGYKSILNQTYIQFALYVTRVSELDIDVE